MGVNGPVLYQLLIRCAKDEARAGRAIMTAKKIRHRAVASIRTRPRYRAGREIRTSFGMCALLISTTSHVDAKIGLSGLTSFTFVYAFISYK